MRVTRRSLLIGCSGLTVAAAYVCVRLYCSHTILRFLAGHLPIENSGDKGSHVEDGKRVFEASYAFPADFDAVNHAAAAELKEWSLVLVIDDMSTGFRATQYKYKAGTGTSSLHEDDCVVIWKDMHYKLPQYAEPYNLVGYNEKGWVSVGLRLSQPPTPEDRFMGWLRGHGILKETEQP